MFGMFRLLRRWNDDPEHFKFDMMIVAIILFLVSAFMSWHELNYAIWGKVADADVKGVVTVNHRGRYGREWQTLALKFEFMDQKNKRFTAQDDISSVSEVPADGKLKIVYFEDDPEGSARMAGRTKWVWIVIFFGTLVAVAVSVFVVIRGYYAHQARVQASDRARRGF